MGVTEKRIAGVVVLYQPDNNVMNNILTYLCQIEKLYIVDNSETARRDIVENILALEGVSYHWNGENRGIAYALNLGVERAVSEGFQFLLTMDQDSQADADMVSALLAAGIKIGFSKIGILAPMHQIGFEHEKPPVADYYKVVSAWTSGSLLNLTVFKQIEPFREDLFIDFVDHEFCMRLGTKGYEIYKVTNAKLNHSIGENLKQIYVFGIPLIVSNHSPLRRYYITRNRFFVTKLYRKCFFRFYLKDKIYFLSELYTILLFEKDKWKKMKMILCGLLDYQRGRLGKFPRG